MKAFLITIDTEGDNLWSRPRDVTTRNSAYIPRFQAFCERFDFKPTYLTNYEMAMSPAFQEIARDILDRDAGEVGMHLHAWDSPPIVPLTGDDAAHHPYLVEFPESVMREKVATMTCLLEKTFGQKIFSHRAGRWGFNEMYARILVEFGYVVDCSVTPLLSWRSSSGDPTRAGGPDYSRFPDRAYFVDLNDVSHPGNSPLLEIPLTVIGPKSQMVRTLHRWFRNGPRIVRGLLYRAAPPTRKLVPNGRNLQSLLKIVERAVEDNRDYIEFTLHSSEFMPGGSPRFRDEREIDRLYEHLELLFCAISRHFTGMTLKQYHDSYLKRHTNAASDMPRSSILNAGAR